MNNILKYRIEIITDADKLTEALSLRYKIYSNTFPLTTVNLNGPYESDEYDCRSIHLGLYCENAEEKKLVGYSRLIIPKFYTKHFIQLFINNHPLCNNEQYNYLHKSLPLFDMLPDLESVQKVKAYCKELESASKMYFEASRLIIDEQHRNLFIAAFFVNGMTATAKFFKLNYSFFACYISHATFYNKLGLTLFPGINQFNCKIYHHQKVNLFGTDLTVNTCCLNQLRELEAKNQITFSRAA